MPGGIITIINGHPDRDPKRLCHGLAQAYEEGARHAGHVVHRIDVADLNFPVLRTKRDFEKTAPPADILAAQVAIRSAQHLVIIYPLWLGTMPALFKAFLEQVFRPDFAYKIKGKGMPEKLLKGRSARIVITMGMPALAYRWFFFAHSLRSLERNILKFSGLGPIRNTIFGMVEAADAKKRAKWLQKMTQMGKQAR